MVHCLSLVSSLTLHFSPKLERSHQSPTADASRTNLLCNFKCPFELKQVHAHIIKTDSPYSVLPLTRVGFVCAFTPSFVYAQQIFEHVDKPEVVIWNSCLKELAQGNSPIDAILLFYQLRQYNVYPDAFTCSFVLKACLHLLDLPHGRIVHGFTEKLGLQSNLFLQNTIIHLYASCGAINDARLLFEKMSQRDTVTWNIMITQLVLSNVESRRRQFIFLRRWKRRIHEYSNRSGFRRNVCICNTLIDMYIKCGCLEAARRVFEVMEERTIVSWSAMIQGLAMHGHAEEALRLFSKMMQIGVKPNGVTFIGLLYACSHMGLINEGRMFFSSMTRDHGIIPQIEHYGCMVDLFSRAGLLQEAHEFIRKMPIKPNGVVWGAFLGGCRVHKNVEMAEEAIKHLLELDPLNDGYYVVLSNIYAEAKRWEDTARVRKLMRDQGVKKTPGCSSITIDGVVHEFVAGDETHPQAEEIHQRWEKLLEEMKLKGYVPNTSVVLLDMEENEKEKVLYRHSEKLALVFGLMNTPTKTPIRIMKNLRVCEDCHAALKLISEIVDREIIVRDRNRFHCFKDGCCSCGDYW
ncbi:hypothetical protein F0562_013348 [Nyssa sinensis]|uniref:DYW domain-containing protein n=1 Tax=Nyssa sinensis TaxID=561372 RepID=A0A5J4ZNN8_9ASTE|nr:hypothetical protein F0562_013348 [Nyssa sinensis]